MILSEKSSDNDRRRFPTALLNSNVWTVTPDEAPRFTDYKDILIDHRSSILATIFSFLVIGLLYCFLATPVFRGNLLIQVEESMPDSKAFLNETSGLFEVKTPTNGEIQMLGSRLILGGAVDEAGLQISAEPRYIPIIGVWLSGRATGLSTPGILGIGGFVSGQERIEALRFSVPKSFENGKPFIVTALGGGRYRVEHELLATPLQGDVGQILRQTVPDGVFEIDLSVLDGLPGAQFSVTIASRARAIEELQTKLQMIELGKLSNVISVSLEDTNRVRLYRALNAIGTQYVFQNTARKSAEAEKTLAFLDAQLPIFERQLLASENAYATFRNLYGNVAFEEEAKVSLNRTSALESNLLDLQQRRRESDRTFTDQSPRLLILDKQIGAVQGELKALNARVANMPNVQRDALRLERDVKVNSELYQSMQNNVLQMRLLKEGRVGNVRLLDKADIAEIPVKPQKLLIIILALTLGMLVGPGLAIFRTRNKAGIRNPDELEASTGLNVYAVLPQSAQQERLNGADGKESVGASLLADAYPHSESIEALRNLRVALKSTLANADNNRILVTGATPGVGKSFIACNFAALLAQSDRRVLLINADLRRGHTSFAFGLNDSVGLSEILAGGINEEEVIHANVRPHLDVLTSGKLPDFPADMLESKSFTQLLKRLSSSYDLIVIDTAPILTGPDAITVALACGVVLLVARAEQSQMGEINESIRRLQQAGASIDGVLFNGMNLNKRYNSRYCYRHRSYRYIDPSQIVSSISHT